MLSRLPKVKPELLVPGAATNSCAIILQLELILADAVTGAYRLNEFKPTLATSSLEPPKNLVI